MAFAKPLIILIAIVLLLSYTANAQLGAMVEIEDVKHNTEVQELGKYSVSEYNNKLSSTSSSSNKVLAFVEVVSAKKQIVSGTKYYLTINAEENGVGKMFEAQVVVKPWMNKSPNVLLGFRQFAGN